MNLQNLIVDYITQSTANVFATMLGTELGPGKIWIEQGIPEINDGIVDGPEVLRRRDELIHDVHALYEFSFGVDQAGHELFRLSVLPDERAA